MKVFIIGSMSCEKWIRFVARVFKMIGCEVDYAKKQPEKRFDTLVAEAFCSIADADLIVAIGKADGTFGEGTIYELVFAEFIGKAIIKFNLEEKGMESKMSNDITTEYTKKKNIECGRKGYCDWKREKSNVISPKEYGIFIQGRKGHKKRTN